MSRSWPSVLLKVHRSYWRAHGRLPNLVRPRRFTEKMQWRKLFDLDPDYAILSDKIASRDWIAARVGAEHLAECLWWGADAGALPFDRLAPPYFIKAAHGSHNVLYVDAAPDAARRRAIVVETSGWLARNHGARTCEPGYLHVPPRLIVERPIRDADGSPPLELKAYAFDGRVRSFLAIRTGATHTDRLRFHLTRDWDPLPWSFRHEPSMPEPPPRPARLDEVVRIAETLAAGRDHLRIDLYAADHRTYVGEVTVYSQSGLSPLAPDEADRVLGDCWRLDARPSRALRTLAGRPWTIRPAAPTRGQALVEPWVRPVASEGAPQS